MRVHFRHTPAPTPAVPSSTGSVGAETEAATGSGEPVIVSGASSVQTEPLAPSTPGDASMVTAGAHVHVHAHAHAHAQESPPHGVLVCPTCNAHVPEMNMEIHEVRCKRRKQQVGLGFVLRCFDACDRH